jgi:hypothetical protein
MIPNTQRKLREAKFFYGHLARESQQRVFSQPEAFAYYLSAFVSAARSVGYVLQKEEKKKYDVWFPSWERSLTSEERKLLKFMNRQRVAEVHSEGAETTAELEYIPIVELRQDRFGHPAYGLHVFEPPLPLGQPPSTPPSIGRPVHYFTIDGNPEKVVEVCGLYLQLSERLVHDFIEAHESG